MNWGLLLSGMLAGESLRLLLNAVNPNNTVKLFNIDMTRTISIRGITCIGLLLILVGSALAFLN